MSECPGIDLNSPREAWNWSKDIHASRRRFTHTVCAAILVRAPPYPDYHQTQSITWEKNVWLKIKHNLTGWWMISRNFCNFDFQMCMKGQWRLHFHIYFAVDSYDRALALFDPSVMCTFFIFLWFSHLNWHYKSFRWLRNVMHKARRYKMSEDISALLIRSYYYYQYQERAYFSPVLAWTRCWS